MNGDKIAKSHESKKMPEIFCFDQPKITVICLKKSKGKKKKKNWKVKSVSSLDGDKNYRIAVNTVVGVQYRPLWGKFKGGKVISVSEAADAAICPKYNTRRSNLQCVVRPRNVRGRKPDRHAA